MRRRALVAVFGLVTGFWGLRWGLPGAARLRVFPDGRPSPEFAARMADEWQRLYARIRESHAQGKDEPVTYVKGVVDVPPGWHFPPEPLLNSMRSMLLQSDHPDEKKSFIILAQMRPWKLEFDPFYLFYGGSYIYPLGAYLQGCAWVGLLPRAHDMTHFLQRPEDMRRLYFLGRAFIVFFHAGTLVLLFELGRRLHGPGAGLAAALLFGLTPAAVLNAHLLKPHPYATFWALLSLLAMLRAHEDGGRREYWTCGAAAGMAAGANISLLAFAAAPLAAWLLRRRERRELSRALGGCALAGAVVGVSNPYLFLNYREFLWDVRYSTGAVSYSLGSLLLLLRSAVNGLGAPLAVLAAAGVLLSLRGPRNGPRGLLGAMFFVTLVPLLKFGFAALGEVSLRAAYPLVALAVALGVELLFSAPLPLAARTAALALLFADAGLHGAVYLENMSLHAGPRSARALAADWIDGHVPPGATVGLVRFPEPSHTPPFAFSRYRLRVLESPEKLAPGQDPEWLVADEELGEPLRRWIDAQYDEAAAFEPARLGWARMSNVGIATFVNGGMRVYRNKRYHG